MFSCECFKYVDDFGVVVFWVSVCVLAVLVDDFVGFLEDFGAGGGFVGHLVAPVFVVGLGVVLFFSGCLPVFGESVECSDGDDCAV